LVAGQRNLRDRHRGCRSVLDVLIGLCEESLGEESQVHERGLLSECVEPVGKIGEPNQNFVFREWESMVSDF